MKAFFNLLLFLGILGGALAQNTPSQNLKIKKVSQKEASFTMKYHVLQDKPELKHGPYLMQGRNWKCEGQYSMGERTGIWSYYGWTNQLDHQFNFSTNKMVFDGAKTNLSETMVYQDGGYIKTKVDSRAFYFGGEGLFMQLLARNIRYPAEAQSAGAQGLSVIAAEIDETGKIINLEVAQEAGYAMDEEALRVIRLMPNEWIPAMIDGKPIRTKHYIPVRFATH